MGHRIFLYGASEDVNRDAVTELRRRFPADQDRRSSQRLRAAEQIEALVDEINKSEADILFISAGKPRRSSGSASTPTSSRSICARASAAHSTPSSAKSPRRRALPATRAGVVLPARPPAEPPRTADRPAAIRLGGLFRKLAMLLIPHAETERRAESRGRRKCGDHHEGHEGHEGHEEDGEQERR